MNVDLIEEICTFANKIFQCGSTNKNTFISYF